MTQYFALLRLQLLSRYADLKPRNLRARMGEKKGKTAARIIGFAIAFAYLLGILIFLEYSILNVLMGMGVPDMLMSLAVTAAMLSTLILAFFFIMSTLYFGRDAAFIASLPVRDRTVLAAKLTQIWLSETGVAAAFLLPAGILYGLRVHPGALFYLRLLLVWAGVSVLPIAIASFLSTLLIRLTALWKRRELAATISGLVLLFAYMVLCMNMGSIMGDDAEAFLTQFMTNNMIRIQALTRFFPPAGWAARGLLGDWGQLLLFLLICSGAMALTLWALGFVYRRLSMLQAETPAAGKKGRKSFSFSSGSAFKACCVREIKQIFRVPAYATNILPICFMPVMIVAVMVLSMNRATSDSGNTLQTMLSGAGDGVVIGIMAALMCYMAGINPALSSAVTREGRGHAYLTALPVAPGTIVLAKLAVGMGLSLMGCIPAAVLLGVLMPAFWPHAIIAFVITALYCFLSGCIALANDTANPKLDWLTETEAIKQKSGTLVGILVGWAILAVLAAASYFMLRAGLSSALYVAVLLAVLAIGCAIAYRLLMRTAEEKYCQG